MISYHIYTIVLYVKMPENSRDNRQKEKSPETLTVSELFSKAGCEIRTRDLMITNQALYRLS